MEPDSRWQSHSTAIPTAPNRTVPEGPTVGGVSLTPGRQRRHHNAAKLNSITPMDCRPRPEQGGRGNVPERHEGGLGGLHISAVTEGERMVRERGTSQKSVPVPPDAT
jgi:hypothetical protein